MDLQTACVFRPTYLTVAFLVLVVAAIASGISAVIAFMRRSRRDSAARGWINILHIGVGAICIAYFAAVGLRWGADVRSLEDYERRTRTSAPAVRAAIHGQTRSEALAGMAAVAILAVSVLTWRGVAARRAPGGNVR